jgi:hypothetical protein
VLITSCATSLILFGPDNLVPYKIMRLFCRVIHFLLLVSCPTFFKYVSSDKVVEHPVSDFRHYSLVKPRMYHGRQKRKITTTKNENDLHHLDHLTVTLPIDNEELVLDLTLNKQLIPEGFFRKIQENRTDKVIRPGPEEIDLCHYKGKVRGKSGSWVALSTCDGLSGVIYDGKEMHYVERNLLGEDNVHFLYKHSDLIDNDRSCGYAKNDHDHDHENKLSRYKRAVQHGTPVRGPYNSNRKSKYLELVLVVDHGKYKELNESVKEVEHYCKNIANIIYGLYAPLNIFVALVGVVIWTDHDEITKSSNPIDTLTGFLRYRRQKLVPEHFNDNAQLVTKFVFEKGTVAKALKGTICTFQYSGGVTTDFSPVAGIVAGAVAHVIGHNFGMEHDSSNCSCPDEKCIMTTNITATAPTHWSSCSVESLELALSKGMGYCLENKPVALFDGSLCGNGFVEEGEECDCGLPEYCTNQCCDPETCKLYGNASCATGECCDLKICKLKGVGTLCRSADQECDLPEYCTGQNEYCPDDVYKTNTEICADGEAFCYEGSCRTRSDQCKLLWGPTGEVSDEKCYKLNVKGGRHGHCGYSFFNETFVKCNEENILCGMLHCTNRNDQLEFGLEATSILSHAFLSVNGSIKACKSAVIDLGLDQADPGMVPNGAKCGESKMCVNQKCVSVSSVAGRTCPHNCFNNGWCNNLGHCHCKQGYTLPFCEHIHPGGSVDSGPVSN